MTKMLIMIDANFFSLMLAVVVAIGYVAPANAVLGGDAGSVEKDRLRMNAILSPRQMSSLNNSYSVNEALLPTGTHVRQYVSKAGKVFAVTWKGPFMPDLRLLMGSYFDSMIAHQAGKSHAGQRTFSQHEQNLVIESGGRPRHFIGRAYLLDEFPTGVSENEIEQ